MDLDQFTNLNFQDFKESDVREEFITPLLHFLGYRSGSSADIIREASLRYPRISLGRKNPGTDHPLVGRADYILRVENRVRWTMEAKSPQNDLTDDDVHQAYSYANHAEVRGVAFALTNGHHFVVYQTNLGPEASPIIDIAYGDIPRRISELQQFLAPQALLRNNPTWAPDLGQPLAPGLGSLVRISRGLIEIEESTLPAGVPDRLPIS